MINRIFILHRVYLLSLLNNHTSLQTKIRKIQANNIKLYIILNGGLKMKRFLLQVLRMMLVISILVSTSVTFTLNSSASDPNLALNPGFENGAANWANWSGCGATFSINNQNYRTGSSCASISTSQNGYSVWAQEFHSGFSYGDHVYASVYIKTSNVTTSSGGGARLAITCIDNTGNAIGFCTTTALTGTQGYTLAQALTIIPDNTVYYKITLEMVDAIGTVYFDDVVVNIQTRTVGPQASAQVIMENNMPVLYVDGQKQAPMFFCGNTDITTQTGLQNIYAEFEKAKNAGLNLGSIVMSLPWSWYNMMEYDNIIQNITQINPNIKLILRVRVTPPYWWYSRYPGEFITYSDSSNDTVNASYGSVKWQTEAAQNLRYFIRHVRTSSYSDHVIGYYLSNANTDEWFYTNMDKYGDYNPQNVTKFRQWLTAKYATNSALQAAWGNGTVTLTTAAIPTQAERTSNHDGMFMNIPSAQNVVDYIQYHNEVVADTIKSLASIIKQEAGSQSLVGTFYGYLNEISHCATNATNHSGHLAIQKLLSDPNIDIIGGPYSYRQRGIGNVSAWHGPIDSVMAAGKLYMMEDDTNTYLSTDADQRAANQGESIELIKRNFGQVVSHGAAVWYFDLYADGMWNDTAFWNEISNLRNAYQSILNTNRAYAPEVAVIYSETAPYRMRSDRYFFDEPDLSAWRYEIEKAGASVGFYYMDQIHLVPDSTKVYIFANAFDIDATDLANINAKVKRNNNVAVFTYAPGYITSSGYSTANMSTVTGMTIEKYTTAMPLTTNITNSTHAICQGFYNTNYGISTSMKPAFYVNDAGATVLGKYTGGNKANSFAIKDMGTWKSIFTGSPGIPAGMIKNIISYAGGHVYASSNMGTNVGIYANSSILTLHGLTGLASNNYTINLPRNVATVMDVSSGALVATNATSITTGIAAGKSKIFKLYDTALSTLNILQNPSFESAKNSWNYYGSDPNNWSIVTDGVNGTSASKITKTGAASDWFEIIYQDFAATTGKTYSISGYVKTNITNAGGYAAITVVGYDINGNVVDYLYDNVGSNTSFTQYSRNYKPSASVTSISIQCVAKGVWNNGDSAVFDHFAVIMN